MPDYDYQYLKMLADNQHAAQAQEGNAQVGRALEKGLTGRNSGEMNFVPPQIANSGRPEYYQQAAPVNAHHYNEPKDNPAWKSDASLTASPGHHGADLQVPYRYEPDVNQRIDDAAHHGVSSMVAGFQNLLKLLSHSK